MIINADTRVLVVDDTSKHLQETANFAKRIGYKIVDTASNNTDALNKIKYQKYGLIISDNSNLFTSVNDIPFILTISESSSSDYKLSILGLGIDKYLVMPFSEELLKHTIEEI
jgi:DNA-binding response OmpR family regulator